MGRGRYAIALVALTLLMGACADDSEGADDSTTTAQETSGPTVLSYDLIDYGFDGPSEAPVGPATIEIKNAGTQLHHLTVGKLKDGVTYEQLEAMATAGDAEGVDGALEFYGGVQAVSPDGTATAQVDLDKAGDYAILCFIPAPDGQPHFQKGMIKPFEVKEGDAEVADSPEKASTTVSMIDFAYDYDAAAIVDAKTIEFKNDGTQNHEAFLFKYDEGKSKNDLLAYFGKLQTASVTAEDKPPGTAIGGAAGMAPGKSNISTVGLEPGTYAMFCAIPNPKNNGLPHILEGMYTEFTVTG